MHLTSAHSDFPLQLVFMHILSHLEDLHSISGKSSTTLNVGYIVCHSLQNIDSVMTQSHPATTHLKN